MQMSDSQSQSHAADSFDAPIRITAWRQFRLLFWKNWIRKRRGIGHTCCELIIPLVFMLILVGMRASWSKTDVPQQLFTSSAYSRSLSTGAPQLVHSVACACEQSTESKFGQRANLGWIAFTSSDDTQKDMTQQMMKYVRETLAAQYTANDTDSCDCDGTFKISYSPLAYIQATSSNGSIGLFRQFNNQDDLNSYLSSDAYDTGRVRAVNKAVIVQQIGTVTNDYQWSYIISANTSDIPANSPATDPQVAYSNSTFTQSFYDNGLLSLQFYIDQFIIANSAQTATLSEDAEDQAVPLPSDYLREVTIAPMPEPDRVVDSFAENLSQILGLYLLLAFLWPFSRLIKQIVDEKEKKIKEGLAMIGAGTNVYMASWIVLYAIGFFFLVLIMSLILKSMIFPHSDWFLLFIFLYVFVCSLIALAILMSSLFDSAKLAGLLSPIVVYATVFPFFAVYGTTSSMKQKEAVCILPASAFALGAVKIANLESAGTGANWSNVHDTSYNFSLSTAIMWMLIDTILILFLAWYLDKVLPKQYGTSQPWYFLFNPAYWRKECTGETYVSDEDLSSPLNTQEDTEKRHIEVLSPTNSTKIGVRIKNLTKQFLTDQTSMWSRLCGSEAEQKRFTAVNKLDLELQVGQLFVLLGHNGAGKTTTINMLTGMYPPSSGTATVFGLDIRKDMNRIRQNLGVCPQHSVVWEELTVEEHLQLFGGLKGLHGQQLNEAVEVAIKEVTLEEKRHAQTSSLSGGQNRRLCLAMALIGDSKVVFLDEPTSGVDPHSRRAIWNLLHQKKHDRIIILTTHFMDEADELADRIAILSKGKIKCCGSSLYLKKQWGVGYSMTLTRASAERDSHLLQQHDGGDEEKDDALVPSKKGGKIVWDPASITTLLKTHIEGAEKLSQSGGELCFRLPLGTAGKALPGLLTYLDENKEKMGVGAYGLSVTTLEDVFLKVAQEDEEASTASPSPVGVNSTAPSHEKASLLPSNGASVSMSSDAASHDAEYHAAMMATLVANQNDISTWRQFMALLKKRAQITRRDKKALCCQIILPIACLIVGLASVTSYQPSSGPMTLDMSQYDTPNRIYVNDMINPYIKDSINSHSTEGQLQILTTGSSLSDFDQKMFDLRDTEHETHYGAFYSSSLLDKDSYITQVNISAIYGQPIFVNAGNKAILRGVTKNQNSDIAVSYQPFLTTQTEEQVNQASSGLFTSLIVTLAFAFVPASYCVFIVLERETSAKHLQMISGVGIMSYWISNFVWDLIMFSIPAFICVLVLIAEGNSNFKGDNVGVVLLSFVMYGLSVIPFTYLCSFAFKSHLTAQNVMILIYLIGGMGLVLISFLLYLSSPSTGKIVRHLFRILPTFCLGDTLFYLNVRQLGFFQASQWDLQISGFNFIFMTIESVVYFALVLVIEFMSSIPELRQFISKSKDGDQQKQNNLKALVNEVHGVQVDHVPEEDSDVVAEREWMQDPHTQNDALIQLHGLRKVFPRTQKDQKTDKVAVQNLYFSVRSGEIFGFLGQNGAGKTTTLKILTGDLQATSGHALLHGYDLREETHKVRRFVGYCPQFDALHSNLTGQETLEFYARIRGIPERNIPAMVNYLIDRLGFRVSAIQPIQGYSGGTKRKVSVGVALIGSPPIVFLDEPSTGMDPVSRRFIWNFISETMSERAVILTTHSMEEAEALCNRIAILNSGALQCLGTSQHLKSKFGKGQNIDIRCALTSVSAVRTFLQTSFPNSKELECSDGHIKIQTTSDSQSLASIFSLIEANREKLEIVDYSVGQISLEAIFLLHASTAKQAEEMEEAEKNKHR